MTPEDKKATNLAQGRRSDDDYRYSILRQRPEQYTVVLLSGPPGAVIFTERIQHSALGDGPPVQKMNFLVLHHMQPVIQ